MGKRLNLLNAACRNIFRHKLRSLVVILCLVAILFPFVTAISLSEGVRTQSLAAVEEGGDLYVTINEYGRNAAIPLRYEKEIERMNGVTRVVPRVIGRVCAGDAGEKILIIAGIRTEDLPESVTCIEGRVYRPSQFWGRDESGEAVIGQGLARYYDLKVGDLLKIEELDKLFRVVGIFSAGATIWSSDLIFMGLEDAANLFKMKGMASDLMIRCRPGYADAIWRQIPTRIDRRLNIQSRALIRTYFRRGFTIKQGMFTALYIIAFAVAIPAILVTSGLGLSERRREIGILKATGWQTQEVLEMVAYENVLLSLTSVPAIILLSIIWLRIFNGAFLAQFFIAEIGLLPDFPVPARYTPLPVVLAIFFSLVLTMVGSIYSSWRAAIIPPAETIR